ncbi:alpha/beta hydrolase [Mycobacterium sp.]|uniref:alpha/beta fold hydrolase n=1 Tax=Mycobacterium sp. TaxID=1785 RepID=UPI002BFDA41B|nr:alpha/beta hydrolase [Mycobacterium sp.]HTY31775.1 alpha/beta hydrolase [Mycobacterium sp.]HUO38165.1 alpha/beta hydrolase [Mycobacterium sp.]
MHKPKSEPSGFVAASDGTLVHFVELDLHSDALRTEVNDPVVLIHGLGCSWHHWSRQIGWIAHARRVVAVDVRGGGGKTRWTRPGWTTANMAADIYSVVTQLGLHRPAVVGCSMGGTIALQYALDYPTDLSRLVVLASFAGLPEEMAHTVADQSTYIKSHTLREIAEERVGAAFTVSADRGVRAWMVDMIAGGDKEGYQSQAETTFAFDVRGRLGEIAAPTTIIHGDKDATVPVARGEEIAKGIPGATLHVLSGEGHFANVQAPEKVNPLLADALGIPGDLVPKW